MRLWFFLTLLLAGCADDCAPREVSGSEPVAGASVSDQPDAFAYEASATAHSATEEYRWTHSGKQASAVWSGSIDSGAIRVVMFDGCGEQVYDSGTAAGGGGITRLTNGGGHPGQWVVQITYVDFTGSAKLAIDRA